MNSKAVIWSLAVVVITLSWPLLDPCAMAQCDPVQMQKIPSNWLYSVSVSGDTAVVGSWTNSGCVYVYENIDGTWTPTARLAAADGSPGDQLGLSVSVSGDAVVAGAPLDDDLGTDSGSAYVFEKIAGAWRETAKLTAADGSLGDLFGKSVALSEHTAIIGARHDDGNVGSAYVFEKVGGTWTERAKLTASDGGAGDLFGTAVALNQNIAVIGARADDGGRGSAYVFERFGEDWKEMFKLTADDRPFNEFGASVSVSGDTVIVGAWYDDDLGLLAGSAYVFERVGDAWIQVAKLTASEGKSQDLFGVGVSMSGDTAVIGTFPYANSYPGSAYVFERAGGAWTEVAKLRASDGQPYDGFGYAVSITGETTLVTTPFGDGVYIFDLKCGPTLRAVGRCPGQMAFVVEGATAGGRVAYLYALGRGSLRIPNGNPCPGTQLGLDATTRLGAILRANSNGTATIEANVSGSVCGSVFTQAVDLDSCSTTNVAPIE